MTKLIRTDKNGTKYYVEDKCPKCCGQGYIPGYEFIAGGICFKCNGSGIYPHGWKEYTEEYAKKLADRRLAKARAKSEETNKKTFKSFGMSENGEAWLVLGNTYDIKDELKESGARFDPLLGWHYDHEVEGCLKVTAEQFMTKWEDWTYQVDDGAYEWIEQYKKDNAPKTESKYVGEVGEKIASELTFVARYSFETHFTYYGETNYIYKFADADGNTYVWKTGKYMQMDEGTVYTVRGTIKEHTEYNGDKQTVLTRCKVA